MDLRLHNRSCISLLLLLSGVSLQPTQACSRIFYESSSGNCFTGRSMDWMESLNTKLWVFPRGMKRDGGVGPGSVEWTSKFGSVVTSIYDFASSDGMNEAGLVANMLYLVESDYGVEKRVGQKKLSAGAWLQYVLDNFPSVSLAVSALKSDSMCIVAPDLPTGKKSGIHLSLSDTSNNSAILEYIDGNLVIHEGSEFRVMTNSPSFDRQLAIKEYWEEIGGATFLPGTHRAADRFSRLNYNLQAVPKVNSSHLAVATVFSIMRHISVPLGISDPHKPNQASTLWRTVSDHSARRYYFELVTNPSVFWVDLGKVDFSHGAHVKNLVVEGMDVFLAGEVSGDFVPAKPFRFIRAGADGKIDLSSGEM
mmetsp:Transcript_17236/g.30223  ORF Transcript_17236/g.30223 Transcript_17236/m.30223 type:complete len:365 (+) Transcript_17236:77-1171(+)